MGTPRTRGERYVPPEHPAARAAYEAEFSYTVGLCHSYQHPEVVLVGGWEHALPYLNVVGDLVKDGERFPPGSRTRKVLAGYEVRFDAVGEQARDLILTWAHWANDRMPFEAVQLVFPDTQGRWPEDLGYHAFSQPLLLDE